MEIHLKIIYSLGEGSVQAEVRGTHGNRFFPFSTWFSRIKLMTSGLAGSIFTHCSILLENFSLATCTYLFFPISLGEILPLMEYLAIYKIIFYCQNYKDATVIPWVELRKDSKELTSSHKALPPTQNYLPHNVNSTTTT